MDETITTTNDSFSSLSSNSQNIAEKPRSREENKRKKRFHPAWNYFTISDTNVTCKISDSKFKLSVQLYVKDIWKRNIRKFLKKLRISEFLVNVAKKRVFR